MKILFGANNFFIFVHTFQWTPSEFSCSRFSSRKYQSQQKLPKAITHFKYKFTQKTSLIWQTSTNLAWKIICSQNKHSQKFSLFTNFPSNMCLFGVKKNICTAPFLWPPRTAFLKLFESKCLYISVYLPDKKFVPKT